MSGKYAYEAIRSEGTIKGLPEYSGRLIQLPDTALEQLKQMDTEQRNALTGRVIQTAHYLFRVSPTALKLVLDERVDGHLNVFTRLELAGLEVYLIWARHLIGLSWPVADADCARSGAGFEAQINWLNEVDCMFPISIATIYFQMRREFVRQKKLITTLDLYSYIRSPENAIFSFGSPVESEDLSLALECQNIYHALYGDMSEKMIFDVLRDIGCANNVKGMPVPPAYW